MGARQSYLYIYLKNKEKKCSQNGCDVTPSKTLVSGSIDFEVVTYTFNYNGKAPTSFDIYLYDSKEGVSDSSYIFGYCSPRTHQVANKVEVYYSVLSPSNPLVITFVTTSQKYNCIYDDLKYARWNWASYITEHTFRGDVLLKLNEQYRKLNLNKTIKLAVGDETTIDVTGFQQDIGEGKKNYRIIYTPNGRESVLNSNCIFNHETIDGSKQLVIENGCKEHKANDKKNQIDPYCLTSVKDHYFDGIIVYYNNENGNKNTALYLEFIDLRQKDICLKRMDQEGCWWAEEKIEYNDNNQLETQISKIKTGLKDGNTVLLDAKATYTGVTVTSDKSTKVYIKYTHEFASGKGKELNILFARTTISITANGIKDINAKHVEVYYLKVGDKDDTQPFLIALYENGVDKLKKAYHFTINGEFKDWIEFIIKKETSKEEAPEEQLTKIFKEKVTKIEQSGSCIKEITSRRFMAYQILTTDEIPTAPAGPPAEKPTRPELEKPGSTTEPLNLWLIIGCSVGGFLLLVALVVGYGIYWYNTTIKLLT